ncbi:hypothetical protein GCM10010260_24790 [Streptomyces filipinensis]|uniref:Uncharacterized protein n=1 Tax=Streptomyces filipinensis TaxID=66887 RepID=A0A918I901_9ACTN|nr:hypothetical protein GCM10010260_24790 [Streptomyces filipinensis]
MDTATPDSSAMAKAQARVCAQAKSSNWRTDEVTGPVKYALELNMSRGRTCVHARKVPAVS